MDNCTYTNNIFTKHIKEKIDVIFECGSRDGIDSIKMFEFYKPQKIFCFECNPDSVKICKENLSNKKDIILTNKAVSNSNGEIYFYATDMDKSSDKNIGASSALLHLDNKESFFQKKITVDSVTLKSFMEENGIEYIDLLCMDLQGYEKIALEGLGEKIKNVKYIISEISFKSYYSGDVLFDDYKSFLEELNFSLVEVMSYGGFGDAFFINNDFKKI
jgi:FkbM family methyltransferase